jgi:hypothetical protein
MALVNSSRINIGLPQLPDNVPSEFFGHFQPVYTAIHNLAKQLSQYAGVDEYPSDWWNQLTVDDTIYVGGTARWYTKAYEDLSVGHCVSPIIDAGSLKVRKANATNNTKPACGFVTAIGTGAAGTEVEVMVGQGLILGVAGMTPGNRYFLSTSDGLITGVAPAAAGNIRQVVGLALASNRLLMNLNFDWTQL